VFVISAALMVVLAKNSLLGDEAAPHRHLPVIILVAIAGNIILGGLTLISGLDTRILGAANLLLDCTLAALFFWGYGGAAAPLLILGTLAILPAAFRFGWKGLLAAALLLIVGSGLALLQISTTADDMTLTNLALSLVFLAVSGVLGIVLHNGGWPGQAVPDQREIEAARLRVARERTRAIYEMANVLSATLDYRLVLETAQDIGALSLQQMKSSDARLISMVLLFQGKDNLLRVITARGLTRADESVTLSGTRGVLGLALKQAQPVFGGSAKHDPELRYFAAFQDVDSVLVVPLRAGYDNYGVLVFGSEQANAFSDEHVEMLTAIGTQATIALQKAVLYQNLRDEKERLVEVEEGARKKLARDLHDGPTQSVAAIAMRVNYIRRLIERQPQQATEELWKVEELARRTTKEIRHMLFTMRPLVLETQGLIAAFEALIEKMRETYDTKVVLQNQPGAETLIDVQAQGVLFYIIEEAVNNARKHAQAEQITVRLYRRDDFVVTEIEDNGVGFDVAEVNAGYENRGSLGMVNMRERTELIEGTLHLQSAPGKGTKITILCAVREPGKNGDSSADAATGEALQLQSQQRPTAENGTQPTRPPGQTGPRS